MDKEVKIEILNTKIHLPRYPNLLKFAYSSTKTPPKNHSDGEEEEDEDEKEEDH